MKYRIILLVFTIIAASCSDWLHVKPTSESESDEFLSAETGYKGALTGLYLKLKDDKAYGNNLTMGFVEYLAQHWYPEADTEGEHIQEYNYLNANVESRTNGMFLHLYNVIAEANEILENIDERKEVFADTAMYQLIKAEALGIRAMVHFDLLRLWGPLPAEATGAPILPYVTEISRDVHEYVGFDRFIELALKDLNDAERLLEYVDPLREHTPYSTFMTSMGFEPDDNFWLYRPVRMNYYAVLGLKARIYLWKGDKVNARIYARKVIDAQAGAQATYMLGSSVDMTEKKNVLPSEHILALDIYDLDSKVSSRFKSEGSGNYSEYESRINSWFESSDIRKKMLWEEISVSTIKNVYTLSKYFQSYNTSKDAKQKVPLIRLSEMYLIAIECGDAEAETLYNDFCTAREIAPKSWQNIDLQPVLLEQYNKEFFGEGVMFYTCKRLAVKRMQWGTGEIENLQDVYVLPLPSREVNY